MMKTIDKMTDQEIYDLTDKQVEKLIVIRCAEEGVRFMDEPPVMKTYGYKSISPSHFFYYLEGLNIAVVWLESITMCCGLVGVVGRYDPFNSCLSARSSR